MLDPNFSTCDVHRGPEAIYIYIYIHICMYIHICVYMSTDVREALWRRQVCHDLSDAMPSLPPALIGVLPEIGVRRKVYT